MGTVRSFKKIELADWPVLWVLWGNSMGLPPRCLNSGCNLSRDSSQIHRRTPDIELSGEDFPFCSWRESSFYGAQG